MKTGILGLAVIGASLVFGAGPNAEEGFVSLFNGKDLTGWIGATPMYGVEKGELVCMPEKAKNYRGGGNLCTAKQFDNFILRFEFCMPVNGNNGVGIRMSDTSYSGMCELQLLDDGGSQYYDAKAKKDKLKAYQYTASVYGVKPVLRDNIDNTKEPNCTGGGSYVHKPGLWNTEEVRVVGGRIQVVLNGHLVQDFDLAQVPPDVLKRHPELRKTKGHIGWLGHGHRVRWRNIRVKEVGADYKLPKSPKAGA